MVFLCVQRSICGWTTTKDEVSRSKRSSCHIFDLLSKLSEKTEQLIGNQPNSCLHPCRQVAISFPALHFKFYLPHFHTQLLLQWQWSLECWLESLFSFVAVPFVWHQGHTSSVPAANTAYCCIILKAVVSNDSQESIICIYRLCFYVNNQLVITM